MKFHKVFCRISGPALTTLVLATVMARLVPHMENLSPIGAMAIFAGATIPRRTALALLLTGMIISDAFIGFYAPYMMLFVYFGSCASILIGSSLCRQKRSIASISISSISGAILFYLLSNFGFWLSGLEYPMTLQGLVSCYIAAFPFFKNTLASYLFFGGMLFGLHRFFELRALRLQEVS